ncbi:MAG: YggS family pyridoxal phosphate-dependent enzyme [Oscillospiraceae bacterium]|nr:YggS family pyridoxal phosphate-dependent enzyme [Oscillospiraceae bacterium]
MSTHQDVIDNCKSVMERVEKALQKAGRNFESGDGVRIMAVTKTVEVERVNAAVACGLNLLGENRVQEFLQKCDGYSKAAEVHFIGGLQTNKVRQIIGKVSLIQSVDREKLALEIDRQSALNGLKTDILLEVNIAGEESKHGFSPDSVLESAHRITELSNLRLCGLMTIPPIGTYDENAKHFAKMQRLFEDLKCAGFMRESEAACDTLSMGMSGDFEEAIQYGSTLVRLGSVLFGGRK